MVWKNAETGFHGVELFPKLASMPWKTGESGFHGVETTGGWKCAAACYAGGADNGDKSGFHAVELFGKVASMPWKNLTIWVPWRGKPPNSTSMPWNFSGGAGKRRLTLRRAGKASGGRVDIIPEPCRFKSTVDFVFRLDAPPANANNP